MAKKQMNKQMKLFINNVKLKLNRTNNFKKFEI